jgi:hypothetical protein
MGEQNRKSTRRKLEYEQVRMKRAQRRLVEFELVERKVALGLTILLTALAVFSATIDEHTVAAAAAAGGIAAGGASLIRGRAPRRPGS